MWPDPRDAAECYANDEPEDVCRSIAERQGFEFLDSGAQRDTFTDEDGEYVWKFDRYPLDSDWLNNTKEVRTWDQGDEVLRRHLVPVIDHADDNRWIKMPRADTDVPEDSHEVVGERLGEAGWVCGDIHDRNLGYHEGRLKLFDYGEGCKRVE